MIVLNKEKKQKLKLIRQVLSKVINKNAVLPVLTNVKFENKTLVATNLEVTVSLPWFTELPSALVDWNEFVTILDTIPEFKVNLVIHNSDPEDKNPAKSLIFTEGKRTIKVISDNPDSFPKTEFNLKHSVKNGVLYSTHIDLIKKAMHYSSKDVLRPMMTGVYFEDGIISTDATALYWHKGTEFKYPMCVPQKALELLSLIGGEWNITVGRLDELKSEEIAEQETYFKKHNPDKEFKIELTSVLFENPEGIKIVCRLLDGNYPNYKNVIPENKYDQNYKITFTKADFLKELPLFKKFANASTKQLNVTVGVGKLHLKVYDIDFSREYTTEINMVAYEHKKEVAAEGFEFGVNLTYLETVFNDEESEVITFHMTAANRAIVVNTDFLVMPLQLHE